MSKRTMETRGVLFDFNGTLARLATWATHEEVFMRWGLQEAAEAWGDRWMVGPSDGEEHVEHSSSRAAYHHWELERFRARARACEVSEDIIESVVTDLDRATKTFTMTLYGEVVEVLCELRNKGLLIAVCSNWYWDLDKSIDELGLTDAIDVAVTSAQAGARKPHPRIFQQTLQKCNLQPGQALYVGDNWGPDVEGPLAVGMRAVHLWRAEQADEGDPPALRDGVLRITDLRALLDLL